MKLTSRRGANRVVLTLSACAIALAPGCAQRPGEQPSAPEAIGTFAVESPLEIVAGDRQAWILTDDEAGAALSTIDVDGRRTDVLRLQGQGPRLLPYRDGVVVAVAACVDEACMESATEVTVVDGRGETLSEQRISPEADGLDSADAGFLIGIQGDLVWLRTAPEVLAFDPQSGRTVSRAPSPRGAACLIADGVYTLTSTSGWPGSSQEEGPGPLGISYDVIVQQLIEGKWTDLPDTKRTLTEFQLLGTECVGGTMRTGPAEAQSPAWSPTSGWFDAESYTQPGTPVAITQEDQRFVLQDSGLVRRVFAAPNAPLSVETLSVPADIFVRDRNGAPSRLLFGLSSTIIAGCIQQTSFEAPIPAQCYISSI